MIIKPKMNFSMAGVPGLRLDKNKLYRAIDAINQPGWREGGLIFVQYIGSGRPATGSELRHARGFLLGRSDYTIDGDGHA